MFHCFFQYFSGVFFLQRGGISPNFAVVKVNGTKYLTLKTDNSPKTKSKDKDDKKMISIHFDFYKFHIV